MEVLARHSNVIDHHYYIVHGQKVGGRNFTFGPGNAATPFVMSGVWNANFTDIEDVLDRLARYQELTAGNPNLHKTYERDTARIHRVDVHEEHIAVRATEFLGLHEGKEIARVIRRGSDRDISLNEAEMALLNQMDISLNDAYDGIILPFSEAASDGCTIKQETRFILQDAPQKKSALMPPDIGFEDCFELHDDEHMKACKNANPDSIIWFVDRTYIESQTPMDDSELDRAYDRAVEKRLGYRGLRALKNVEDLQRHLSETEEIDPLTTRETFVVRTKYARAAPEPCHYGASISETANIREQMRQAADPNKTFEIRPAWLQLQGVRLSTALYEDLMAYADARSYSNSGFSDSIVDQRLQAFLEQFPPMGEVLSVLERFAEGNKPSQKGFWHTLIIEKGEPLKSDTVDQTTEEAEVNLWWGLNRVGHESPEADQEIAVIYCVPRYGKPLAEQTINAAVTEQMLDKLPGDIRDLVRERAQTAGLLGSPEQPLQITNEHS